MTWTDLSTLPLIVETYEFERLSATVAHDFERVTTQVRLRGGGAEGLGEDVSPYEDEADTLHVAGPVLPLAGEWTLESFCDHLAELDQWPIAPEWDMARRWRNWAFESAALDLALNQAGRALHEVLGREPRPVRFVNSLGLGDPPTFDPIRRRLELHPGLRFKLDATAAWTPELIDEVAATGAVEIVDFKGHYGLEIGELPELLAMYERVIAAFPDALLEDAHDLPEVAALLEPEAHRISYDAPIQPTSATSTRRRSRRARSTSSRAASATCARCSTSTPPCEERGLIAYGGGMGELDVGRGQIQLLASLFHPDGPNDVAPGGYNARHPGGRPPAEPAAARPGADGVPEVLAEGLDRRAVLGARALATQQDGEADEITLAGVGRKRHGSSLDLRSPRNHGATPSISRGHPPEGDGVTRTLTRRSTAPRRRRSRAP